MSDSKKKRMSMLDNLATAAAPPTPSSMMSNNRALRSARDAVDGHTVWELDPLQIETDHRIQDRLDLDEDLPHLTHAIETNGQTVPILVRRKPDDPNKYLLVYGRRRLEAIRQSDKVQKVRALVANLNEHDAVQAQISENMARRDLSFIEKAMFAQELIESGFGTQNDVAEVLAVTKSSVSMALSIVQALGRDLVRAIGPCHGIGRPRWDAMAKAMEQTHTQPEHLIDIAEQAYVQNQWHETHAGQMPAESDPSHAAFDAVMAALQAKLPKTEKPTPKKAANANAYDLGIEGTKLGSMQRTGNGLRLDIGKGDFADWVEQEAEQIMRDLYAMWKTTR